jgi:hypothetical protein
VLHVLFLALALQSATVQGIVRAQGSLEPLPHATVTLIELKRTAQADARGYFVLTDVPDGRWRAEASAIGYDTHAVTLIVQGANVRIDFELPVRPVPMPIIEVRSTATGVTETATAPLPQVGPPAVRVQSRALRSVPGLIEPDVLRALQTLPSIAAMSDFSTALYVRGGAADQSVIMLDGMPLFNPYHVGGIFSAIPIDAVATVDVWAGAMPARAGDRVSGAVHVHTRDGGRDRVRAAGGIGLLSSHATFDGPLGRGTFLLAGRRTYIDAVSDAAYGLGLTNGTIPYGFWDFYGKATMPVGELGAIAVSGYINSEGIHIPQRMQQEMGGTAGFDWGSRMLALNYRQPLSPSLLLQAHAGYTDFRGRFDAWEHRTESWYCEAPGACSMESGDTTQVVSARTHTGDAVLGGELTWYRSRNTLRAGVQLDVMRFDHALDHLEDVDEVFFPLFAERRAPVTLAAHAEDEWRISDRLAVRAGARVLHAGAVGTAVLPRAGMNLQLTPRLSVTAGGGSYAQALRSKRNDESMISSFIAYDLITAQPLDAGLARGSDVVLGIGYADVLTALRAEGFLKTMSSIVLPGRVHEPMESPVIITDDYRVGRGRARGLELSAQRRHGRAELGLSYSLLLADRTDSITYTPRFERRHTVDANAVVRWREHGMVSARLAVGSGQSYTPAIGMTQQRQFNPATGQWEYSGGQLVLGDYNSARLPGYLRLDVAARRTVQRRWFGRDVRVTPYLQVLNVLNTRNTLFAEALPYGGTGGPALRYVPQLPILPTFGFEWQH